jgi:hypothetical protein
MAAYQMAQLSLSSPNGVWIEEVPPTIVNQVQLDISL